MKGDGKRIFESHMEPGEWSELLVAFSDIQGYSRHFIATW